MLDREVIKEFLEEEFSECDMEIPEDISMGVLVEIFCKYVEDDYYEWIKDNFKSFFDGLHWDWIRDRIEHYAES
ncbi:TPA: hypothetical protein ENS27_10430 [bacterium]|nr:hypothetical protein [bacterium]